MIIFKDKRSKIVTQEMERQGFYVFLAMTSMRNNKNNTSWTMTLALAEYSRGTLLKFQSTMSYFGLQASNAAVIKHSSCYAKHSKTIGTQNMSKENYL